MLREGALVAVAEVTWRPGAVFTVDFQQLDGGNGPFGRTLPAANSQRKNLTVGEASLAQRYHLLEALARRHGNDVLHGVRRPFACGNVRFTRDSDVAEGLVMPEGHVVAREAD